MNRRSAAVFLAVAGVGLASAATAAGALAALFAAPVAAGLLAAALWMRRGQAPAQPRWLVGAGALTLLLGAGWLLAGVFAAGLLAVALGGGVIFVGTQLSLEHEPPPAGLNVPDPLSLKTNAAVAADELMRWAWHVGSLVSPPLSARSYATALRDAAERHRDLGWTEHPERAHPVPPALEKVDVHRLSVRGAGTAEHLSFESEYDFHDPEVRDEYLAARANRTAHAYLWRHSGGPRPTLICVHGYGMGQIGWDVRVWNLPFLHRELGLDVAAVVLPLHGPRARSRRSGEGFLEHHPLFTNSAMGQTLWELRRLAGWLRAQGAPALGMYGVSLGGYTTATFASLERRLACAIPSLPPASLVDQVLRDLGERERLAREALGVTRAVFEDAWAPHSPLRHTPRVAPEARLILAGLTDRICPPDQAHALYEHWDRPAIHWSPCSHLVPLERGAIRQRLASHLRATLLAAGGEPLALTRFRTPAESPAAPS